MCPLETATHRRRRRKKNTHTCAKSKINNTSDGDDDDDGCSHENRIIHSSPVPTIFRFFSVEKRLRLFRESNFTFRVCLLLFNKISVPPFPHPFTYSHNTHTHKSQQKTKRNENEFHRLNCFAEQNPCVSSTLLNEFK